jgi:hypothetical protein
MILIGGLFHGYFSMHIYGGHVNMILEQFIFCVAIPNMVWDFLTQDIRRSIPAKLRPSVTNIPASSIYSVRSGSTIRTVSAADSPLATSSNASSEPSIKNSFVCLEGSEIEDNDFGSEKGNSSPASQHGIGR